MKKLITKIFKNCGIGTSHVINKHGIACIKRYGFWTPYLTIFISKIYPITHLHKISQVYHSHQGSFLSFILKGTYLQDVLKGNDVFRTSHKWFNYLPCGWHHKIICHKPVYTLMFMGKRKCEPTVRLKESGRKLKHERFFTISD